MGVKAVLTELMEPGEAALKRIHPRGGASADAARRNWQAMIQSILDEGKSQPCAALKAMEGKDG